MIAFIQPFGLQSPGGGSRILRALLENASQPFISISTAPALTCQENVRREVHLPIRPHLGRIESTRLAAYSGIRYLDVFLGRRFEKRLEGVCRTHGVTALHAIPHGIEFWYAFRLAEKLGMPYYLNVHDDMPYNLQGYPYLDRAMKHLAYVWPRATGRMVISEAIGEEYCRRYGNHSYVVVTDGLKKIAPKPRMRPKNSLRLYFMGLMHGSYASNVRSLFQALDLLQNEHLDWHISFTTRGGILFDSWSMPSKVPVRVLPWGTEREIEEDLKEADVLYFPLPFEPQFASFSRFSLSTKMVTYLGSGLPILYHGPAEAAAGRLLFKHEAALQATSLDPHHIERALRQPNRAAVTQNALALADAQFRLEDQRSKFWKLLVDDEAKQATYAAWKPPLTIS